MVCAHFFSSNRDITAMATAITTRTVGAIVSAVFLGSPQMRASGTNQTGLPGVSWGIRGASDILTVEPAVRSTVKVDLLSEANHVSSPSKPTLPFEFHDFTCPTFCPFNGNHILQCLPCSLATSIIFHKHTPHGLLSHMLRLVCFRTKCNSSNDHSNY